MATTATKKKSPVKKATTTLKQPVHKELAAPVTASVFDRGLCFQFTFGMPGFRGKVDKDQIDVKREADQDETDKKMLSVGKKLLECDEYDAIRTLYGTIKKYLGIKAIPTTLRKSYYLIPMDAVEEVMAKMLQYQTVDLPALVDKLVAVYPETKANAKKRLGALYHEDDYMPVTALKGAFYMEFNASEERVPGRLEKINPKMYLFHSEQLKNKMLEAAADIRMLLRKQLHEATSHLKERLEGSTAKGEKKVFRQSAITHIMEFIENFNPKDVTDDRDLALVVKQLEQLMKGVDVETLRDDEKFRTKVAQDFGAIVSNLDVLVTAAPIRAVKLPSKVANA
jgi:hypothetical protein